MSKKKHKAVQICWEDSCRGAEGWTDADQENLTPATVYSVGYIHKRTRKYLILIPHSADNGNALGTLAIPTGCIRKISKLK